MIAVTYDQNFLLCLKILCFNITSYLSIDTELCAFTLVLNPVSGLSTCRVNVSGLFSTGFVVTKLISLSIKESVLTLKSLSMNVLTEQVIKAICYLKNPVTFRFRPSTHQNMFFSHTWEFI